MEKTRENLEYRSDVFSLLLQEKERALEVYNAMNGTAYDDPELVEIVPVENRGISLSVRNDASFVLDATLSIYEHQSTICPNMPVRNLIYFANIIHERIRKKNVYGKTLIKIPAPRFVVFYNGTQTAPERYEMRLSDAFEIKDECPQIELTCQFYNINTGYNKELIDKCPTLKDYMYFVDLVRYYHERNEYMNLRGAIECAIDQSIAENVLKQFLIEHRSEVVKMMQLDYTFERQLEMEREESYTKGREEGRADGRKDGMEQKLLDQIQKKIIKGKSLEQIADDLEESVDTIQPLYEQLRQSK